MNYWVFSNKPANFYNGSKWDTASIFKSKRWYFGKDNDNATKVRKGDLVIARTYGVNYFARFTVGSRFTPHSSEKGIGHYELVDIDFFNPPIPQDLAINDLSNQNVRSKIIRITKKDFDLLVSIQHSMADGQGNGAASKNSAIKISATPQGAIRRLTSKEAVLKTIHEYDDLGAEVFLDKYGFGRARTYLLFHNGKYYDSKAIAGVAYGHEHGRPLKAEEFGGGLQTVVPRLMELGFQVIANQVEETIALPEEAETSEFWEGAKQRVVINSYERNPEAREACIQHYGPTCYVCGFDFAAAYGDQFMGFIHVHHLVPVSARQSSYKVNPKRDLRPVCPNCHAMIHYGGVTRKIKEAKALIEAARKKTQLGGLPKLDGSKGPQ